MDINELWQKMQGEFRKQNERLDKIEVQVAKIPEIERQVAKIPEIEKQVAKIPEIEKQVAKIPEMEKRLTKMEKQVEKIPEIEKQVASMPELKKEVKTLNNKVDILANKVSKLEYTTDRIDKKLDDTININIAKILNEQTAMRVEMNAKFNLMMLKHDRDYKKLEYQIAKLANDAGMNYLV